MPGKTLRKGSLVELKATNVPRMYQPSANKATISQRRRHQRQHKEMIKESANEAMKASATRQNKRAPNLEFPAPTPAILAKKKQQASHIPKWRKGKTIIPHEIKRLAYKGPKLSPVGEEAEKNQMQEEEAKPLVGGTPPAPLAPSFGKDTRRRKRTRSKKEVPKFAMPSFAEETEEEVKEAAKGAVRAPTLSDLLKYNPDYPKLKAPRTRRRSKRSVMGYAPDEDNLGPLGWGGKRKRRHSSRKTRRRRH